MRLIYNYCGTKAFDKEIKDLIRQPVVVYVNKFDEESSKKFASDISEAHETSQGIIPIVIDSYGGQIYSLLYMIDTIKNCSIPVATICKGKAMSCGAILLSCGAEGYRFAGPNSTIMIHELSAVELGKNEEIQAGADECARLNKKIFEILAQNCGKSISYFEDIYRKEKVRADWFLNAQDAKMHNLINEIRIPNLSVKLSVRYELE